MLARLGLEGGRYMHAIAHQQSAGVTLIHSHVSIECSVRFLSWVVVSLGLSSLLVVSSNWLRD